MPLIQIDDSELATSLAQQSDLLMQLTQAIEQLAISNTALLEKITDLEKRVSAVESSEQPLIDITALIIDAMTNQDVGANPNGRQIVSEDAKIEARFANIKHGLLPSFHTLPTWAQEANTNIVAMPKEDWKDGTPLPWMEVLPCVGNQAFMTSIEVGPISLFARFGDSPWELIGKKEISWWRWLNRYVWPHLIELSVSPGSLPNSKIFSLPPGDGSNYSMHAGIEKLPLLEPLNITGLFSGVWARLVPTPGTEGDIHLAQYAMFHGVDFYPYAEFTPKMGTLINASSARPKLITGDWTLYVQAPIDPPGPLYAPEIKRCMSIKELIENPPPIPKLIKI